MSDEVEKLRRELEETKKELEAEQAKVRLLTENKRFREFQNLEEQEAPKRAKWPSEDNQKEEDRKTETPFKETKAAIDSLLLLQLPDTIQPPPTSSPSLASPCLFFG
eukprot:TRINITY_DN13038_c0_g1_i4.p1 TRINITY_DN13038_c0_g1~~TRINITY_DN13038_c0_g1_i4.p1  ORF type:complete len:107 (-),score=39.32 TRINITY_DN13038_c0_g1_i4:111-431(-)